MSVDESWFQEGNWPPEPHFLVFTDENWLVEFRWSYKDIS